MHCMWCSTCDGGPSPLLRPTMMLASHHPSAACAASPAKELLCCSMPQNILMSALPMCPRTDL